MSRNSRRIPFWPTCGAALLSIATVGTTVQSAEPTPPPPAKSGAVAQQPAAARGEKQPLHSEAASSAAIAAALDKPIDLEFVDTPLMDVVDYVKDFEGIPMQIDVKALEAISLSLDSPITFVAKGLTLRSSLRLCLKQHGLKYVVENEVLLITTAAEADRRLVTTIYNVSDLIGTDEAEEDCQRLSEAITATVRPQSWNDAGGLGAAKPFVADGRYVLSIAQSADVHDEIASFLDDLRRVERHKPDAGAAAAHVKPQPAVKRVVYKFDAPAADKDKRPSPQDVAAAIRATIAPKTWSADERVAVVSITGGVVVTQTTAVHKEIRSLLESLGVMQPSIALSGPASVSFSK